MVDVNTLYYYLQIAALFAVSVVVGRLAGPLATRLLETISGKTKSTLDDRVIAAIKVPLESFFFLAVFYFLLHNFPELASAAAFLEKYTLAILIAIATFLLSEASGAAIRWYYEEGVKISKLRLDLSLLPLMRKVSKLAIYLVGFTIALSYAGFDVTGLLAVTSVFGIVLGLASQETLANLFAGLALQMDRPYHYGDYLRFPSGEVAIIRKIGMRSTRLEDREHNTIIISNSELAKMRLTNLSLPDDISIVSVAGEFPLSADIGKLKSHITASLSKAKPAGILPERGYSVSIDAVKPSSVLVSFSFWVKGYEHAPKIKEHVSKAMLEFARKAAKK
jgi:MscS family membrane protein